MPRGEAPGTVPTLPVAVIGAGPIGLSAAVHLLERGETPLILEAGSSIGASVREWAHVRLFSPWRYVIDPAAAALLEATGWAAPEPEGLPTGGELLSRYLEPLAALPRLAAATRLSHRVVSVTRHGMDKVRTAGRETTPFELMVETPTGPTRLLARAVIDASGTWQNPNPIGAGGVPARGEIEARTRVHYGIPDIQGVDRALYAGRRTLVVGSGHSAFNAVLDLVSLAALEPRTRVLWAIRRRDTRQLFGGGSKDALAARGALGSRLRRLVEGGQVRFVTGFQVDRIEAEGTRLAVAALDGRRLSGIDRIVAATGYRPELALTRELRLRLDPWLEAPEALAPLIDPNLHSCGTVYPHGALELSHPEPDFYTVGMKSYGRAPTFLLLTGYEQVRSVVCALAGDVAGAREVKLTLPETGVCRLDLEEESCCEPALGPAAAAHRGDAGGCRCSGDPLPAIAAPVPAACCA
ncbi:MAG: NAD(P)-binding domain-containing protein [Gemmatimonadales bacterium]